MAESEVSMKLLVDTVGKRVLFAEAGKECVDFLFSILSLPLATLIRLLGKQQMVGSLGNLYESIETLHHSYIQPNRSKEDLLAPRVPLPGYSVPLLSLKPPPTTAVKKFYNCGNCMYGHKYVTDDPRAICGNCSRAMTTTTNLTYVAPPAVVQQKGGDGEGGFVKGVVTYMVMDDLVVKPLSTISSITLLAQFNVKDLFALEERVVKFGMTEAVKLLKASLESDKVLTSVFFNLNN
ncbi:hypothetical protein ACS0TY_014836 [Phlomoides rotata]